MMDDFFNQSENSMPRIGDQAPAFRSVTAQGTIYFPADYFGKWVILFSYPSSSTPVHTSEFLTLANMHNDFKALNCELIGLSVNSPHSRIAGFNSIEERIEYIGMKDVEIKFPLIEDIAMEVARKYGMIKPDESNRAVFFIDPECNIRAISYYPLSLSLNIDELKQVIIDIQAADYLSIAHTAGWHTGDKVTLPTTDSYGITMTSIKRKDWKLKYFDCFSMPAYNLN
jgi:peroxiredoxin (alkyl hydroperoxide reductase subunit C)